jgi:hypothetical protein
MRTSPGPMRVANGWAVRSSGRARSRTPSPSPSRPRTPPGRPREVAPQHATSGARAARWRQELDDLGAQRAEDGLDAGGGRAALVQVVQHVVGGRRVVQRGRRSRCSASIARSSGAKAAKSSSRARLRPHLPAARPLAGQAATRSAGTLSARSTSRRVSRTSAASSPSQRVGLERRDQRDQLGVGRRAVAQAGQRRHLAPAGLGAAGRHVGALVPRQQGGGLRRGGDHGEAFAQGGEAVGGGRHARMLPRRRGKRVQERSPDVPKRAW